MTEPSNPTRDPEGGHLASGNRHDRYERPTD